MIDVDTIIQNIESKIQYLEKLKFEDDPKSFLYTPIKAITITSTTDFKQLECQKFIRCTQSNKLVPLEKFSDSIQALKDEVPVDQVSMQHKRNYRRNSIANFEQKQVGSQVGSLAGKKRRNSTKFDSQNQQELRNQQENGHKKSKINPDRFTTQTSSPIVNPRPQSTKPDQQQILKRSATATGSPKFSRSYTEFLNNLNKDMQKFKEQQMRNEPCDNFLGKDAKIFVENPILKHLGGDKDDKVKSSCSLDDAKTNGSNEGTVKPSDQVPDPKSDSAIQKISPSLLKTPIYGTKYLVKPANPHPEPNKPIFDKIIKYSQENFPQTENKTLNKIVMRRMTIDSAWDHRSLLRKPSDVSEDAGGPTNQNNHLQKASWTSPVKVDLSNPEKSLDKLQKIDLKPSTGNKEQIQQKTIKLSPQNSIKTDKIIKLPQNMLKNLTYLKQKVPRRNSIGYGVRIETANDIKRLKLSQDLRKNAAVMESLKRVGELVNKPQKPENKEQNVSKNVKLDEKLTQSTAISNVIPSKMKKIPSNSAQILNNSTTNSIDYEDELESISACHIDKLAPENRSSNDKSKKSIIDDDFIAGDDQIIKNVRKNVTLKTIRRKRGSYKIKSKDSAAVDDDKLSMVNIVADNSTEIKEKNQKVKKISNGNQKSIKRKQLTGIDQKNNNLEEVTASNPQDKTKSKDKSMDIQKDNPDEGNSDKLVIKTLDIFRDIENYKNLIRQQSSDSQSSNKTDKIQVKIEKNSMNFQEIDNISENSEKIEEKKMELDGNHQTLVKIVKIPQKTDKISQKTDEITTNSQKSINKKQMINSESQKLLKISKVSQKISQKINKTPTNPQEDDKEEQKLDPKLKNLIRINKISQKIDKNKTDFHGKIAKSTTNHQEDSKRNQGLSSNLQKLIKISCKNDQNTQKLQKSLQNATKHRKLASAQQDINSQPKTTKSSSNHPSESSQHLRKSTQPSQSSTKSTPSSQPLAQSSHSSQPSTQSTQSLQSSSQPTQSSKPSDQSAQSSQNSTQSIKLSQHLTQPIKSSQPSTQPSQSSQHSTKSTQSSQLSTQSTVSSQSSIPSTSQSPHPSDSQNTPNSDQITGKRRRQINPKYSESEYMLKNTSREFTNAIRSKMMIKKSQKNLTKKPDDQIPKKSDIIDDNCESKKVEDVASTSIPSQEPATPDIKCEICGKVFLKPKGLARHMPLHSSDRRHACTKCKYRFKQGSDLMRHMLLHEESPIIPCPKCDKKFRTMKNLQAHMGTHEAMLPYKCNQCEVRFRSTKNLRYHLMSHHSGAKFQCGNCGQKFSDEKSLRIHVMQHENEDGDLDDEELEDYLDFMDEEDEELSDSGDEPMVIDVTV
ncbi:uncharacterized protein [Chironomus tepperi]|uniref:uncharacterized protein n=1 Tax=Chironomus tepperi TaxID=113505 RepID=UPI00391F5A77